MKNSPLWGGGKWKDRHDMVKKIGPDVCIENRKGELCRNHQYQNHKAPLMLDGKKASIVPTAKLGYNELYGTTSVQYLFIITVTSL